MWRKRPRQPGISGKLDHMERIRSPRRYYVLLAIGVVAILVAISGAAAVIRHRRHQGRIMPVPPVATAAPSDWTPTTPALPADVGTAWAYIDSTEGDMLLGGDSLAHPLDQLVVPGLAEDYLNTLSETGQKLTPHDTVMLSAALGGDAAAAAQLADREVDVPAAVARVVDACQLTTTAGNPPQSTPLDTARYGACLREGAIVDHGTAGWVLDQMRQTQGGIGDVRGSDSTDRLAQFNSTTDLGDGRARTACLAVGAYWSAAVYVEWPTDRGQMYGVAACAQVARDQFPPDTQKAPDMPAPSGTASA